MILWCIRSKPVKPCIRAIVMFYQPNSDLYGLSLCIATYKTLHNSVFGYIHNCWRIK